MFRSVFSTTAQSLVGDLIPTGPVNLTGIFAQFDTMNPLPGLSGIGYQLLLLDDSSIAARSRTGDRRANVDGSHLAGETAFA